MDGTEGGVGRAGALGIEGGDGAEGSFGSDGTWGGVTCKVPHVSGRQQSIVLIVSLF